MALDEHLVAAAGVGLAAEEVVEPDLVERGRRGIGRNMAAHTDSRPLRAVHHDRGVPPDPGAVAPLDVLVTGKPRLQLGRNRVDVVGRRERRNRDPLFARTLQQAQHQVPRTRRSRPLQQCVERLQPLAGLLGIDVWQVRGNTLADDADPVGFACGARVLGQVLARELGGQLQLLGRRDRELVAPSHVIFVVVL